jgi:hypothetical protein
MKLIWFKFPLPSYTSNTLWYIYLLFQLFLNDCIRKKSLFLIGDWESFCVCKTKRKLAGCWLLLAKLRFCVYKGMKNMNILAIPYLRCQKNERNMADVKARHTTWHAKGSVCHWLVDFLVGWSLCHQLMEGLAKRPLGHWVAALAGAVCQVMVAWFPTSIFWLDERAYKQQGSS